MPKAIVDKPATADLVHGQTDEGDLGISYQKADRILQRLLSGYSPAELVARDFDEAEVELVRHRLDGRNPVLPFTLSDPGKRPFTPIFANDDKRLYL